jgi:hypothetical protein
MLLCLASAHFHWPVSVPEEEVPRRVPAIKRLDKGANLVAGPDVAPLEFRQLKGPLGDIREKFVDLGHGRSLMKTVDRIDCVEHAVP